MAGSSGTDVGFTPATPQSSVSQFASSPPRRNMIQFAVGREPHARDQLPVVSAVVRHAAAPCQSGPSATYRLRRPSSFNAHAMRAPLGDAASSVGNG
jgi:hypothetical protein